MIYMKNTHKYEMCKKQDFIPRESFQQWSMFFISLGIETVSNCHWFRKYVPAPSLINRWQISIFPFLAASQSGVYSLASFLLTSAPWFRSIWQICRFPCSAAWCNAVRFSNNLVFLTTWSCHRTISFTSTTSLLSIAQNTAKLIGNKKSKSVANWKCSNQSTKAQQIQRNVLHLNDYTNKFYFYVLHNLMVWNMPVRKV